MTKKIEIEKMQKFLWDAFCDADATGVRLHDLLTWPGLHLTKGQIESVESHYHEVDKWNIGDEAVKEIIADATDCEDFGFLSGWFAWVVGDVETDSLGDSWVEEI